MENDALQWSFADAILDDSAAAVDWRLCNWLGKSDDEIVDLLNGDDQDSDSEDQ